jgi:hypothetical protein
MRPERVDAHLLKIIAQHSKALQDGVIITVSEGRVRVRSLPLYISE